MNQYEVEQTAVIQAPASVVYAIVADFVDGHQQILPRRYFTEMRVLAGGIGAGTAVLVHMNVFGSRVTYTIQVTEPEPGRVLQEADSAAGLVTRTIVEPLGENRCRVTLHTTARTRPGWRGWLEKVSNPPITRHIYRQELALLAGVAEAQFATTSQPDTTITA